MWKFGLSLSIVSIVVCARGSDVADGGTVASSPIPRETRQIIVVQSPSWNATTGRLQRFIRPDGGAWQALGVPLEANLGRNGMAWGRGLQPAGEPGPTKKEGDQRSPAGTFLLRSAFGYRDGLPDGAKGYPYLHVRPGTSCIEDGHSKYYNQLIDSRTVTKADWSARDDMLRADGLFRWGVVVQHNAPETLRGAGSCIFLHIWRGSGKGTAGCTAMAPDAIEEILRWLDATHHPVLVQLPENEYARLRSAWGLP